MSTLEQESSESLTGSASALPRRLAIPAIAALAIVLGVILFTSTGRDDNYITYWPAHTLAEHGQITNINGESLEQSSSLLFTIALAVVSRLTTLGIPATGMVLGVLFGFLTIVLGAGLVARFERRLQIPAALLIATSPPLLYWSLSGMESTLTAVCLIWATQSAIDWLAEPPPLRSRLISLAVSFMLVTTVRPEGGLVLVAASLGVGVRVALDGRRRDAERWRRSLLMIAVAAGCTVFLLVARRLYFGSYVPQPVLAKSDGFTVDNLESGLAYLWQFRGDLGPLVPTCLALGFSARDLVRDRPFSPMGIPLVTVFAYLGFIVTAGGDWMEMGRFLVPIIPLVAMCALDACRRIPWRPAVATGTTVLVLLNGLGLARSVTEGQSTGISAWHWRDVDCREGCAGASWHDRYNHIHHRDLQFLAAAKQAVAEVVALRLGRPIVVMSHQAGMVIYYLKLALHDDIYFVDTCGLVTDHMTTCRLTRHAKKSTRGTCAPIMELVKNHARLHEECGVDPDVVFGLFHWTAAGRAELSRDLTAAGYQLLIAESYPASVDGSVKSPPRMDTSAYLAVRADIAARLARGDAADSR